MTTKELFTIFSDSHIGIYNNFAKPVVGSNLNDRSQASIDVVAQVLDLAIKKKTNVVCVGDLFDKRGSLDIRILNRVQELFKDKVAQLASQCKIYLLAGNHDQIDNSRIPENSLTWLTGINSTRTTKLQVISEPQIITLNNPKINLVFLPYSEDVPWLKSELAKMVTQLKEESQALNILFAHIGVDGATDGGLYTHRLGGAFGVGDLYPDFFDKVFLGHYHNRQGLVDPNQLPELNKILYVGSTSQKSFADEGQLKGADVVSYDTQKKSLLDTFFPIESKQFKTVDLALPAYKELSKAELDQLCTEYYVRLITYDSQEAKQLQTKLSDSENNNVAVALKEDIKTENRLGLKATDTETQIVTQYADKYYPDAKDTALAVLNKAEQTIA